MAMGRPPKYNVEAMIDIIDDYTNQTDIPVLKEVCYKNYWVYDTVLDLQNKHEDLFHSIKRLLDKKEANLEIMGLRGEIDKTMAVFSLKQLGWKDRQEIAVSDDAKLKAMTSYLGGIKNGETKNTGRKIKTN